jgi:6-phosphofructokinase 1
MTIKYIGNCSCSHVYFFNMVLVCTYSVSRNMTRTFFFLSNADPTYMIRAIPSNASDNVYCTLLAHSAIHGAMAGYSFTVGMVNGRHAYIPFHVSITSTVSFRKQG